MHLVSWLMKIKGGEEISSPLLVEFLRIVKFLG